MGNCKNILLELFQSKAFPHNTANSVNDLLGNKKIILYGAGDGFITFSVFVLNKYGYRPQAVLDRKFSKAGPYHGIPAFSPIEYKPTNDEKENAVVVITVGKKEFHGEILNSLHDMGFKNVIMASDIYEYHLLCIPEELDKEGFDYYLGNKKRIVECFEYFSDELSREIFTLVLQTHMQRKPFRIPARELGEQYFPKDIKLNRGYSSFVNCGAYIGDTVKQLNKLYGKVKAVSCFEPDPANYRLLSEYLSAEHNKIADNVIAFPCGVYSRDTQLHFSVDDKINSMISNKGESVIQCVSLDHAIPGSKPTMIQMDVEGVELEVLKGAEKLIRENKPDLAVCVYHSPNHIWEIPIFIKSLNLGYKLYLRNYTSFISETVLYATI